MIKEIVYLGKDNTVSLGLTNDSILIDHATITRVVLVLGNQTVDSASSPSLFDFTLHDRLLLNLGASALLPGSYIAQVTVYDSNYINGLNWGNFTLIVK